ncbi:unnamed protein product [Heterobilharzia americana]|nr:unnamed protein product [Heterobilharzia americana]
MVQTTGNSHVSVNCSAYNGSVALKYRNSISINNALQSYGWILHRIIRYNDSDDHAVVPDDSTSIETFLGSNLDWNMTSFGRVTDDSVHIEFQAKNSLDSHEKINGVIKLIFRVYETRLRPPYALYYHIENSLSISAELILDAVQVNNRVQRFSPVFLVFSNHSMEDNEDFLEKQAIQENEEDGPLGRLKSTFIQLGSRVSKSNGHVQDIWPSAYIQFPPALWTDKDKKTAQMVRLGSRCVFDKHLKTHSYHFSLPFALYGGRFEQLHDQSMNSHVAAREQIVNLGSPNAPYYIDSNYSAWTFILGLGDPNIIVEPPSEEHDGSAILATFCGVIIICGIIGSVYGIRRIRTRYHRIPEVNTTNDGFIDNIPNDSFVEPYQYEKLVQPPSDDKSRGTYTNEVGRGQSASTIILDRPPDYGSISLRPDEHHY